ncbi:MAG: hypothetical protein PUC65_15810 [Clostridiales bacterium]|nr:hypothetical protein [Clostridiales bacterium]
MAKNYERIVWANAPATNSPLNEVNLNKIDQGLYDVDNALEKLQDNVLQKTNSTPFTPIEDYHPATKKYVDEKMTENSGNPSSSNTDSVILLEDGSSITEYVDSLAIAKNANVHQIVRIYNGGNVPPEYTSNDFWYEVFSTEQKDFIRIIAHDLYSAKSFIK